MILLNFSHPITATQLDQIAVLSDKSITCVIDMSPRFDEQHPFGPQLNKFLAAISLTREQWQNEHILIVLPSLTFIAALLLAELHGRMGYFPPVVRTRPVSDKVPRQYEVAEILDLQAIRETARKQR